MSSKKQDLLNQVSSSYSAISDAQSYIGGKINSISTAYQGIDISSVTEKIEKKASTSELGVVKVDGETINVDNSGKISLGSLHNSKSVVALPIVVTQDGNVAIGVTNTVSVSSQSLLINQSISKFYYSIPELNIKNQEVTATNNSASLSFNVPSSLEEGTVIHLSVSSEDSMGNRSKDANAELTVVEPYVIAPSITSPTANETIVTNFYGLTVTTSQFAVYGGVSDTQTALKIKITSDLNGDAVLVEKTVNSGVNTYSFTASELEVLNNGSVYVWTSHVGGSFGQSDWGIPVAFTVSKAYVNTPSITSPSANAKILKSDGLEVTLSQFSCTGANDIQTSVQVDICSDSSGNTIVATKTVSGTGNTVTFTESDLSELTVGDTYYLFGYYTGSVLEKSEKSSRVAFTAVVISTTLEDNSWNIIKSIGAAGNGATYWDIGDRKSVVLNGVISSVLTLSNQTLDVYIIEFNYKGVNGIYFQGFKDHSSGVDLALCDAVNDVNGTGTSSSDGSRVLNMNHWGASEYPCNTNYGGWKGCDLRYDILGSTSTAPIGYGNIPTTSRVGYDATTATKTSPVANTLMAALPNELRDVLALWTVYSDNKGNESNVQNNVTSSVDYLPLLSEYEVFGVRTYANQYEKNQQAQMSYYANGGDKIKRGYLNELPKASWWLRSADYRNAAGFCCVYSDGRLFIYSSLTSCGISPAFRVA